MRHSLHVQDISGDTEVSWDPTSPWEVEEARQTFEKFRSKGYMAFRMESGSKGKMIREFDPKAERIVISPPVRGG
jgi:hypothetical protein